jgi:hypothetical protein
MVSQNIGASFFGFACPEAQTQDLVLAKQAF